MDSPIDTFNTRTAEAWQDALLVQIAAVAHRCAARSVARVIAEDVAQDVVLACVKKLRSGRMPAPPMYLEALIKRMVRQRAVDYSVRDANRARREQEYSRAIDRAGAAWMQPDIAFEYEELDEIRLETLEELSPTCRQVFVLVRDDDATYKMAGRALGLTPLAICAHVVAAQRVFRDKLARHGITQSKASHGRKRKVTQGAR